MRFFLKYKLALSLPHTCTHSLTHIHKTFLQNAFLQLKRILHLNLSDLSWMMLRSVRRPQLQQISDHSPKQINLDSCFSSTDTLILSLSKWKDTERVPDSTFQMIKNRYASIVKLVQSQTQAAAAQTGCYVSAWLFVCLFFTFLNTSFPCLLSVHGKPYVLHPHCVYLIK